VYFQGSTQPELSILDSAAGGNSIKINKNEADGSVNQDLYQKKTISNEHNFYHKVSFENHIYVKYLIILTVLATFQFRTFLAFLIQSKTIKYQNVL
jgi:hypothetical protein